MAETLLLVLLYLIQASGIPDCPTTDVIEFVAEPHDVTVCAGNQAKIDCTYTGSPSSPLWRINSTTYPSYALPPNHRFDGRSLVVTNIFLEYNDTTYQCYFDLFVNGSVCQVESTIGKLTVQIPTSDACVEKVGPKNITLMEGETEILIPCTVSGTIPPIWEINGYLYEYFQLPEIYRPIYRGLVIKLVQRSLNGISFRCYTPISTIGYIVEESSIGYLTVTTIGGSVSLPMDNSNLYIDHQNTLFHHDVTLSWKPVYDPQCDTYKVVSRHSCEQESAGERILYVTNSLSRNISYDILNVHGGNHKWSDFSIKATTTDDFLCNETNAAIQVQNSVTTIKINSSFSRSKICTFTTLTNSIFYLVLPRHGTEEDCFCPVFFLKDDNCFNLNDCFCLDSTLFNNTFIEFCQQYEHGVMSIQLKKLPKEINGNRLSIFHESYCQYNSQFMPPYRIYTHSFEIAIVLPEPPVISIDVKHNEICILPYGDDENPPDLYRISVHDITRERIFEAHILPNNSMNSDTCISIGKSLNRVSSTCAPLLVSVHAINEFGEVCTNETIYSENETIAHDVCSCINETVVLSKANLQCHEESVTLNISCYQSFNFKFEVTVGPEYKQNIFCNDTSSIETVTVHGISCEMNHDISIYWKSSISDETLGVNCSLWKAECTPLCKKSSVLVLILVPISIALIIATVTAAANFFIICWKLKSIHNIKKQYSFAKDNHNDQQLGLNSSEDYGSIHNQHTNQEENSN